MRAKGERYVKPIYPAVYVGYFGCVAGAIDPAEIADTRLQYGRWFLLTPYPVHKIMIAPLSYVPASAGILLTKEPAPLPAYGA